MAPGGRPPYSPGPGRFEGAMPYVRSLDGLRALAILLVMSVHYHQKFGGGWVGVQLFFVLSGFLITRILLASKAGADLGGYLKVFFVRRALRIFPLYFGFIALLELLHAALDIPSAWPEVRPWMLTYTLNFAHAFSKVQVDDLYSHFWSLAAEEQFYLVWPLVVWFASEVWLKRIVVAILVLGPVLRAVLVQCGLAPFQLYFLTPCQLDAFATGAAVAVFGVLGLRHAGRLWICAALFAVAAGVTANWSGNPRYALYTAGYPYYMPEHVQYAWGYTLTNLLSGLSLILCMQGKLPWLEAPWLVGIGRVSYGIYVFHRPVIGLLDRYASGLLAPLGHARLGALALPTLYLVVSLLLALFSYHAFELRFLFLKRYFPLPLR
jgi:peptidoglycan/LPS O-acetylase OafA/YrhL